MTEPTILTDPHHAKADARLVAMAIKRGWKIPDTILDTLPTILGGMVAKAEDDRVKVGAARVIVAMHGQNQRDAEPPKQSAPTVINVGVNVDVDARRERVRQIAERVKSVRVIESLVSE